jgi:hypothetical protein
MAKLLSDDELFGTSAAPQTKLLSDDEVTSDGGSTNRSAGDWLKDLGIAGVQGGLGLEQSVAGLLRYSPLARANQLATGVNPVDVALTAGKFEPEQWTKQLEQQKSPQAQQANQAVQQAQGFGGTLSALAEHPEYIPDQVVQSGPGTLMAGGMARGAAESVLPALQSGVKAIAAKAGTYVAGVGGMMEGAQQSGQMLDKAREQGQSPDEIAPYAAGAGLVDALIVGLASKIPGFKDASMSIAEAGLGATRAGKMVAAKEVAKTAFSEGVLEELPQSMQEQIFQNLADGKPWDEGVANAGVIGAVVGGIQGGGAHLYQHGRDALVRAMQEKMPKIKLGTEDIGNYSDEELTEFLHDDMIPAEAKVKAAVELQRRAKPAATQFPAYGTVPADAATPEASAPAAPPVQPNGAIDDAIARLEQERGIAGQPGDGSGEQRNLGAGSPGNVGVAGQPDGAGAVGGAGSAQGGIQSPVVPAALGGQAPVAVGERQTLLQGAQPVQGVPVPSDPRSEIEHIGEQLNVLNDLQRQDEMKAAQAPAVPNPGQTQQLGLPQPTFRPLEQVAQAMWDQTRKWDNAQLVEQGKAQPLPQTADEIYLHGLNHVLQQRAAVIEAATGQRPPLLRPVSDPQVAKSWERLASALQDLTGIRPIAYEDNTRGAPRGFELSGRPHVNLAQAELPAVYVAMHELKHVAERAAEDYHNDDGKLVHGNQDAKAITSMIHSVFDLIDPEFKRQYATQYLWKSSPQADGTFLVNGQRLTLEQVLDHPTLRSEMTADFMGQRAADPAFWDSLAKRKPARRRQGRGGEDRCAHRDLQPERHRGRQHNDGAERLLPVQGRHADQGWPGREQPQGGAAAARQQAVERHQDQLVLPEPDGGDRSVPAG